MNKIESKTPKSKSNKFNIPDFKSGESDLAKSKIAFIRNEEEEKIWQTIKTAINDTHSLTKDNKISGKLNSNFMRIESGFNYKTKEYDDGFLITHIEPLLDQAADLLDRCLKDRATWDELSIKMFNLAIELNEYKELDAIHEKEEKAGIYEYQAKLSNADYNAETISFNKNKIGEDWMQYIKDNYFDSGRVQDLKAAHELATLLGGFPPYFWVDQTLSNYGTVIWNGVEKFIYEHYQDASVTINGHDIDYRNEMLDFQKLFYETQKEISKSRVEGLKSKAEWDINNSDFQKERTLVSRKLQDIKVKAAVEDDGILNYAKRLIPLKQRFDNDFRDALARLKVVELGLSIIFGISIPLPKNETDVDYYDNCLLWTRNTIQWILKFSRKELNCIYPISVRNLVGNKRFRQMRKDKRWLIDVKEIDLPNMCNIRLRGVSLLAKNNCFSKKSIRQFQLSIPQKSQVRHFITGNSISFDQEFVDTTTFGRVHDYTKKENSDIIGLISLYNCSPLGLWKIEEIGKINSSFFGKLRDIIIELHIGYRNNK